MQTRAHSHDLVQYDWRFGALVRLVKLWARTACINDSSMGTFNSFALTLMVRAWGGVGWGGVGWGGLVFFLGPEGLGLWASRCVWNDHVSHCIILCD